jgi:hypothetical protein
MGRGVTARFEDQDREGGWVDGVMQIQRRFREYKIRPSWKRARTLRNGQEASADDFLLNFFGVGFCCFYCWNRQSLLRDTLPPTQFCTHSQARSPVIRT